MERSQEMNSLVVKHRSLQCVKIGKKQTNLSEDSIELVRVLFQKCCMSVNVKIYIKMGSPRKTNDVDKYSNKIIKAN